MFLNNVSLCIKLLVVCSNGWKAGYQQVGFVELILFEAIKGCLYLLVVFRKTYAIFECFEYTESNFRFFDILAFSTVWKIKACDATTIKNIGVLLVKNIIIQINFERFERLLFYE